MRLTNRLIIGILLLTSSLLITAASHPAPLQQADDPSPPDQVVKLIFIHHSTGENWLEDGYGDLGMMLGQNNYYVSDTNYGWGPDGIGDLTDIPHWMEWFRSERTTVFMDALYNENGQNSGYTRTLSDPGGDNQVILFKSCYPNSALRGHPNDPPGTVADRTVAGSKYVYNQLLEYFDTQPDKLFVVITAPPLRDPTYAANARAFNQWLMTDWLQENNYDRNNVMVFDFYNVLTGPDSHHRYQDGGIQHIVGDSDTLHYPTNDDHPSAEGSKKATDEFIPLLNLFYHRWREDLPAPPVISEPQPTETSVQEEPQPTETSEGEEPQVPAPPMAPGIIDNFEAGPPPGTAGWEAFWDAATPTVMACAPDPDTNFNSGAALRLDFDITPDSWGTCGLFFDNAQNWSSSAGLTFFVHAVQPALILNIDLYVDGPEGQESYIFMYETTQESVDGWTPVELSWDQFHRVDWEADAGSPFGKQDQVSGMAFGFSTYEDTPNTGTIWIDDLQLAGSISTAADPEPPEPAPEIETEPGGPSSDEPEGAPADDSGGGGIPCLGALALPLGLVGYTFRRQRKFSG